MNAFKVLLKILIAIINILNEEGFNIYDLDNHDWYILNIKYDGMSDRLYFDTEEDK